MVVTQNWDTLERWVKNLSRKIQVAKRAEAKIIVRSQHGDKAHSYDATASRSDPEREHELTAECECELAAECECEISPKSLRNLLDSIIKDAKTIQEMLREPAQPDNEVYRDGSAAEKQPPVLGEDPTQQTLLSDTSDSGSHQDGEATEQQLQPVSDSGQRTSSLRRSQRMHAPKASIDIVETTSTSSSTRQRPPNNRVVLPRTKGTSHATSPVQSQLQNSPEVIRVGQGQLKKDFVQKLQENHFQEQKPYSKYHIEDLQTFKLEQYQLDDKHLSQHYYSKKPTGLFISHKPGSKTLFNPSHFEWTGSIPTLEDMKEMFNDLCQKPPKSELRSYYIGPVEPVRGILSEDFEPLVHAGHRLCRRNKGDLAGINTVYMYISFGKKTLAPLHIEDAKLGSVNLVRKGAPKIWLIIDEQWAEELEAKLFELHGVKKECSQAVRHLSTLVSPEQLDNWSIPYYLECCEAGQMIETKPGSYHQVINMGHNIAESVNIEFDDTPDMPSDIEYRMCHDGCGEADALSKATYELSCSNVEHVCSGKTLDKSMLNNTLASSTLEAHCVDTLRRALLCQDFSLALCEKTRLVQMLAQCCKPTITTTECPEETDKIMFQLIQYFNTRKDSIRFADRVHLIRLDSICTEREVQLRSEDHYSSREDYTTPALQTLTQGLDLSRRMFEKLKCYRKYGATLQKLCNLLGSIVLTALPCESIPPDELVLPFSADLQQKIKPSDYHKLSGNKLDFFIKFLGEIFPDALDPVINMLTPASDWQNFTQQSFDLIPPRPKRLK